MSHLFTYHDFLDIEKNKLETILALKIIQKEPELSNVYLSFRAKNQHQNLLDKLFLKK